MRAWPILILSCAAAPLPVRLGYADMHEPAYVVDAKQTSPAGVRFDPTGQAIDGALIDRLTAEVEACVGKPIDRASFIVKVPAAGDWTLNCDGTQQILRSRAPESGCLAKGQAYDPKCPCKWRAIIQAGTPVAIVATPSLLLFKDALTRFVTGSQDPWSSPTLAKCASPTTTPLSLGRLP